MIILYYHYMRFYRLFLIDVGCELSQNGEGKRVAIV